MILFAIWQLAFFVFVTVAIKYLSNYKNKNAQEKKKIDQQINIVGWLFGLGIPIALWLGFAFLAFYK